MRQCFVISEPVKSFLRPHVLPMAQMVISLHQQCNIVLILWQAKLILMLVKKTVLNPLLFRYEQNGYQQLGEAVCHK